VKLEIYLKGFAGREFEIAGGDPPLTVTLRSGHDTPGRSRRPVPASSR
jgi:hypothetical protein